MKKLDYVMLKIGMILKDLFILKKIEWYISIVYYEMDFPSTCPYNIFEKEFRIRLKNGNKLCKFLYYYIIFNEWYNNLIIRIFN